MTETDRHRRPALPQPAPPATTLSQAEEGSATATASEMEEKCPKIKAKEHLEAGAAVAVFGFIVLLGWICLPKEAKHPSKVRFTVSLLLAIATFLSGSALVMLSMTILGLREHLVSGSQRVASKCLLVTCAALSVLTLLSLLAQLPGRVYWYVGLAVVTSFLLLAAGVHWYLRRHGDNGDEAVANEEEHKEELDAVSKVISCVTTSAFGGLVGVLFSMSKIFGAAADAATGAAYAAIFFMFTTAISGVFVMTVLKKVPKITNHRFQRLFIGAMSLANAFLLCSLACAAFAAAFVVLRYRIFVAFVPLVITAILCFLLRHCVARLGRAGGVNLRENQEAQLKEMEDLARKVTAATLGAIMTVFGGSLGEKYHDKAGAIDVFMVVLTSAFVSSFGFMLLAAAPGSAKAYLAPVAKVLVWSSALLFVATAIAVYGMEMCTL